MSVEQYVMQQMGWKNARFGYLRPDWANESNEDLVATLDLWSGQQVVFSDLRSRNTGYVWQCSEK